MHLRVAVAAVLVAAIPWLRCGKSRQTSSHASAPKLHGHALVLDEQQKILPWAPYEKVVALGWKGLARFPVQPNGLPTWQAYSRFTPDTLGGVQWPNNPAGLSAMLVDSALQHYAYSGDRRVLDLVRKSLDHILEHGRTPDDWAWGRVPFASADPGSTTYGGADDGFCDHCGRGDGPGVIEPDKIGEIGYAFVRFFELTDDVRYRDAAVACAEELATHVRDGDPLHSPWPFRVYGKDDVTRDPYSGHVIAPIMLFDELRRLELHSPAMLRARDNAWSWMMTYPMENGVWGGYFEDIPIYDDPSDNPNQYAPLQTARYLLDHPELDPAWRTHVPKLIAFVKDTFGVDVDGPGGKGMQYGAEVMSEQMADMAKMASHTARYASILARWYEVTGDLDAKERAFRSFNWATYWCTSTGIVKVGPDDGEGWWFSDGYGDFMRHFSLGMSAVPEWAGEGNHLLRSTSVVREVTFDAATLRYSPFDVLGDDVLRLARPPQSITVGGVVVPEAEASSGASFTSRSIHGGVVVKLHRQGAGAVSITFGH